MLCFQFESTAFLFYIRLMKSVFLLIIIIISFSSGYSQRKGLIGFDLGYHNQGVGFGEIGISYSGFGDTSSYSVGIAIEDDFSSSNYSIRAGGYYFNRKLTKLPLIVGFYGLKEITGNQRSTYLRPEIGFGGTWRVAQGIITPSLTYGYNIFTNNELIRKRKHLVRINLTIPLLFLYH